MKNKSLMLSINSIDDIKLITKTTKYINIDLSNPNIEVIKYFLKNGQNYLYSEIIDNIPGFNYINYEELLKAETTIELIYAKMPKKLSNIEIAKYLYISLGKILSSDINISKDKNEECNLSTVNNIKNIWGSISSGSTISSTTAKIYYYLCKRMDINITIVTNENKSINKLLIDNQTLIVDLYKDIPYIQCNMRTRYFGTYNDDQNLDKKINYLKENYNDYYLDKALKNIDYTKDNCVHEILLKTQKLLNIDLIKPCEITTLYNLIFEKYCPNIEIKINNLFLKSSIKKHFIIISNKDIRYSYNYKKKTFIKLNDKDIIDNIKIGKIGLYQNEIIPNLNISMNY